MRILFINQYYWPDTAATAQMLTDLAEHLAAKGNEVMVLCSRKAYTGSGVYRKREVRNGARIYRVAASGGGRKAGLIIRALDFLTFYITATWKCIFLPRPDVVVTLTSPPMIGLLGWMLSLLKRTKHVHWCMDILPDFLVANNVIKNGGIAHRFLAALARFYLRTAHVIIVLGPYMKERILAYNPHPDRVHILPVWADGSEIFPVPRDANWFARKHSIDGKFVVQYSGNITLWESYDAVLSAAEKLIKDDDIVFLFIGDGFPCEKLKDSVRERGLSNFRFLPYQRREDLAYSLSAADAHVVLLGREAGMRVPSKIFGIMAVGGSVIFVGPIQNEIADIVTENNIGFIVDEGNVDGFVSAVKTLRDSFSLRHEISQRARAIFEKEYDIAVVTDKFDQLLTSLSC